MMMMILSGVDHGEMREREHGKLDFRDGEGLRAAHRVLMGMAVFACPIT